MPVYTGILELGPGDHVWSPTVDLAIWHVCTKRCARPMNGVVLRVGMDRESGACALLQKPPCMTGYDPILVRRVERVYVSSPDDLELYVKFLADNDTATDAIRSANSLVHDPERDTLAEANQIINAVRAERAAWDIHR